MSRAWVIGNGPSLNDTPLELLAGERTYAVNRIWKLFDRTEWRPTDYVRAELPSYDGGMVIEDLRAMAEEDCRIWLQAGFLRYTARLDVMFGRPVIPFLTCNGGISHPWHFDLGDYICGHGTVVQMAMQLAVMNGADSICLLGCDLGNDHFYGREGNDSTELSLNAFRVAKQSCPVPIYNCTVGGKLDLFERADLWEFTNGKEAQALVDGPESTSIGTGIAYQQGVAEVWKKELGNVHQRRRVRE